MISAFYRANRCEITQSLGHRILTCMSTQCRCKIIYIQILKILNCAMIQRKRSHKQHYKLTYKDLRKKWHLGDAYGFHWIIFLEELVLAILQLVLSQISNPKIGALGIRRKCTCKLQSVAIPKSSGPGMKRNLLVSLIRE